MDAEQFESKLRAMLDDYINRKYSQISAERELSVLEEKERSLRYRTVSTAQDFLDIKRELAVVSDVIVSKRLSLELFQKTIIGRIIDDHNEVIVELKGGPSLVYGYRGHDFRFYGDGDDDGLPFDELGAEDITEIIENSNQ